MYDYDMYMNTLYERHTKYAQDKICAASVAIAGLGGLGSNIAISLARCGIMNMHLIDYDIVDASNINRQQYYLDQIGMNKTDALYDNLLRINPFMKIKTDKVYVDNDNYMELLKEEEYICEAFDNVESKAMLVNNVLTNCPNKYIVSASGMGGYGKNNDIVTRKITEHFYICGDERSGIESGYSLMAPRVAICANHEANVIIDIILNR